MLDRNLTEAARRALDAWQEWEENGDDDGNALDDLKSEMQRLKRYVEEREGVRS